MERRRALLTLLIAVLAILTLTVAVGVNLRDASAETSEAAAIAAPTAVPTPVTVSIGNRATPLPTAAPAKTPEPTATPWIPKKYDLAADGRYYVKKKGLVTALFIGVDARKTVEATEYANNTDQADTLIVGAFDTVNETIRLISIPRDTMTDVKVLDFDQEYAYTRREQIAVQHAVADGGKKSCILTAEAVSNLLLGTPIDGYVAMSMDGVSTAVEAVGGVSITLTEDLPQLGSSMKKGRTVTLNGRRALSFVTHRDAEAVTGNLGRMQRQVQFIKAFLAAMKAKVKKQPTFVVTLYNKMAKSMRTNLSLVEILKLADLALSVDFADADIRVLPGEKVGLGYEADAEATLPLVLDTFYTELIPE